MSGNNDSINAGYRLLQAYLANDDVNRRILAFAIDELYQGQIQSRLEHEAQLALASAKNPQSSCLSSPCFQVVRIGSDDAA